MAVKLFRKPRETLGRKGRRLRGFTRVELYARPPARYGDLNSKPVERQGRKAWYLKRILRMIDRPQMLRYGLFLFLSDSYA